MKNNPNHNMYQRGGMWYFQYKKIRRPLKTDKVLEARDRRDALLKELKYHGDEWLAQKIGFGQVVLDFLKLKEGKGVLPETLQNYKNIMRFYVSKSDWSKKAVSDITSMDVEEWITNDVGVKNTFKNQILTVLSGVFKYAKRKRYIKYNIIEEVERPKKEHYEPQAYSDEEVGKLLAAAEGVYKEFFIVKFFTGMRISEICGLKWQYVDFINRNILVRESRYRGKQRKGVKNRYSKRTIKMLPVVYDALFRQRERSLGRSEWVFLSTYGKPLGHRTVSGYQWDKLVKKAGVRRLCLKDSRHTYISMALREKEQPMAVAKSVGHRDTRMINEHYEAYVPTEDEGSKIGEKSTTILLQTGTGGEQPPVVLSNK